jgi:8-oxo-dGTP pyrophosphatase MutT (NUDIX family)
MTFKLAACVVIRLRANVVFAVTRKNEPEKLGLPGGKQDIHESNLECAIR